MLVARVKHENEGRFLLGTSTCMDLTVEHKEAVTEELYSALAQTPGCSYTAEAWLVASHYQYWLRSPNEAPAQLHRELASRHITEATNSSIFNYFQLYLHILSRVLRRAIPSQKSLQTNTKKKIVHLTSSAKVPRTGLANSQNSTREVFQTSSAIYIHVTSDWPNFIGSLFSWVLDPPLSTPLYLFEYHPIMFNTVFTLEVTTSDG